MKNTELTSLDYLRKIYSAYHDASVETSYVKFPFGKGVYSYFDRDGALSDAIFDARIRQASSRKNLSDMNDSTLELAIDAFDHSYEQAGAQFRIWQRSLFAQFMLFAIDPMFRGAANI